MMKSASIVTMECYGLAGRVASTMTPDERKEFGEFLKRLRLELGLSLRAVSEAGVDISPTYLNQIESGERNPPAEDKLRQLARLYKVPYRTMMVAAHIVGDDGDGDGYDARQMHLDQLEQAYAFVCNYPKFSFGRQTTGEKLGVHAKRFIIELFERATGLKVLEEITKEALDKCSEEKKTSDEN